jgi:hypothetical protein
LTEDELFGLRGALLHHDIDTVKTFADVCVVLCGLSTGHQRGLASVVRRCVTTSVFSGCGDVIAALRTEGFLAMFDGITGEERRSAASRALLGTTMNSYVASKRKTADVIAALRNEGFLAMFDGATGEERRSAAGRALVGVLKTNQHRPRDFGADLPGAVAWYNEKFLDYQCVLNGSTRRGQSVGAHVDGGLFPVAHHIELETPKKLETLGKSAKNSLAAELCRVE